MTQLYTQLGDNDLLRAAFDPQPHYESNQPRCLVVIDKKWNFIPLEYAITFAIHGAADTAHVTIPNVKAPDWTQVLRRDTALGNQNQPVYIDIYAGFWIGTGNPTKNDLKLRFSGVIDQYEIDIGPPDDWTVFTCRSMAAPLIDTKIVVPLAKSMTTQQFIQQMAAQFLMPAPVFNFIQGYQPVTMTQVLAQELIAGVHSYSVWEMFLRASLTDDCDVWVDPTGVIHYEARTRGNGTTNIDRPQITMRWGRDIKGGSKLRHSPQFSKNVQVDIKIYNSQTKSSTITRAILSPDGSSMQLLSGTRTVTSQKLFGTLSTVTNSVSQPYASLGGNLPSFATSTVTTASPESGPFNASAAQGKVAGDSGKERYVKWIQGPIKPADALAQARQMFLEISQHEYTGTLIVPVSTLVADFDINHNINLLGMQYQYFNGQYWPREIVETFRLPSEGSGEEKEGVAWEWEITVINHDPPSGVS